MFRVVLAAFFFITSSALIATSTFTGVNESLRTILGDLGTEIFGILVTIALVDWYLEKRRRQDRARALAWEVLHSVEHAVWVWQGGPRHLGTNELLGVVSGIGKEDPMEPFTEGLLLNVGLQCRSVLQKEPSALKSLPGLHGILTDMVSLAAIRDFPAATRIRTVAEILEASVIGLARVLSQSTDRMPSGLIWYRDPTPEGQEGRYRQMWSVALAAPPSDAGLPEMGQPSVGAPAPEGSSQ